MTKAFWFWVIFILWIIFGFYHYWPAAGGSYIVLGTPAIIAILLFLLGLKVFGPPIQG